MSWKTHIAVYALVFSTGAYAGFQLNKAYVEKADFSQYQIGFSPREGSLDVVQNFIKGCQHEMYMATYDFTSPEIADSVIDAKNRGVKVYVVSDKRGNSSSHTQVHRLKEAGVNIRLNGHYAIHHHKFISCDREKIETGSFNYTKGAILHNAENVLALLKAQPIALRYQTKFMYLWNEAEDFE